MPSKPKTHRSYPKPKRQYKLTEARAMRNSGAWKRFVEWHKRRFPLCCDPFGVHDRPEPSEQRHHIVPLRDDISKSLCAMNVAPLCTACHVRIEQMEKAGKPTTHLFAAWRTIAGMD